MDLFEYQGKQYFARYGIPVSPGGVAVTPDEAVELSERLGYPVVVKAQVQVGGRGKAGGIKLAANADEARAHAAAILGMDIRGHLVRRVWVEHASDIAKEYYASFTLDRGAKAHLAMVSAKGGVDIEQVAAEDPRRPSPGSTSTPTKASARHRLAGWSTRRASTRRPRRAPADVLVNLYRCFVEGDADLVEVNPLVLTPDGRVHALDAKVTLDDNAAFRHPEWEEFAGTAELDEREQLARQVGLQYVGLDGFVGHNRQRRRLGHEHLRCRQPGRRPARQFPGHRGRRQRRGYGQRTGGHQLGPERPLHFHKYLRRHHQGGRSRQRDRHGAGPG